MSTLQEIEAAVRTLAPEELKSLETHLKNMREQQEERRLEELYRRIGFRPLPIRSDKVVTDEMVRRIREEEGI